MDGAEPLGARAPGFAENLRALGATLHNIVHVRAELFALELREETERRTRMLLLGVAAGLFFALGLALVAFLVIILFWDTYRLAAAFAVTLLYLGIGATAYLKLRTAIASSPPAFQATLGELEKDLEALKASHE
jgi:uncharacterized membrane protein YqjE